MPPKFLNKCDVSQKINVRIQNPRCFKTEKENAISMKKINGVLDDKYSSLSRYLLLASIIPSDIPSRVLCELESMVFPSHSETNEVMMVVMNFFYNDFGKILDADGGNLRSSEIDYAKFLLSRCLVLCDKPTYINFMLVAAFLSYAVFSNFDDVKCYRILYISEFCFYVLYRRKFWKVFESKEDYEKLQTFCHEFGKSTTPNPTLREMSNTAFGLKWISLVRDCINVSSDNFSLEESEVKLFDNVFSVGCQLDSETFLIPIETDDDLNSLFESSEHNILFCRTCGTKCYNYLMYMNEFLNFNECF